MTKRIVAVLLVVLSILVLGACNHRRADGDVLFPPADEYTLPTDSEQKTGEEPLTAVNANTVTLPTAEEDIGAALIAGESVSIESDFAAEENEDGLWCVTEYTGYAANVIIPETVCGRKVDCLANNLFSFKHIKRVQIEAGITEIPSCFLQGQDELISVVLPNSVEKIDNFAFGGCYSLRYISIPSAVKDIGTYAFSGTFELKAITLPENLKSIGSYAFEHSGLMTVEIPASVEYLVGGTFINCRNLREVYIHGMDTDVNVDAFNSEIKMVVHAPEGSSAALSFSQSPERFDLATY